MPSLTLDHAAVPANGVYVTRTFEVGEEGNSQRCLQGDRVDGPRVRARSWRSVTNIGYRPTFGGLHLTIETFLIDPLEGDSPARIRVEFLRWLRDERTFPNAEALREQIMKDVKRAQAFFRRIAPIGLI